uniref:Uncharacterized protein n=1 Tax=Peronospora matthiolae TaxID=2874970 RepID=A0AAV1TL07_9STRA
MTILANKKAKLTTLAEQIHDATAGTTKSVKNTGVDTMSADLSAKTVAHDEKSGMDIKITTRIVEALSRVLLRSTWGRQLRVLTYSSSLVYEQGELQRIQQ